MSSSENKHGFNISVDRPLPAEVKAHSCQQGRAETDQLREQLMYAFRQQMDIRRNLMELETSSTEIQMDTSKQLLTIAESVSKKAFPK